MAIGTNIALNHKMNHKLNIFDHTMFHTDKDQLQFIADIADKNNSGADVPIAKIVSPIKRGDNLNILAILTLELISLSAENHNKNNHINNMMTARSILYIYKINSLTLNFLLKKSSLRKICLKDIIWFFQYILYVFLYVS